MAVPAREDRRQQILGAATRVFARKGFHACRVGDIAKEARSFAPQLVVRRPRAN
jgi:AcrR family transcriptional regulator